MPSGTFSNKARSVHSLTNKKNCGGNKKSGLTPRATGPTQFRNSAYDKQGVNFKLFLPGSPCPANYSNNPGGQCSGGVGSPASTRNRGCRNYGKTRSDECANYQTITLERAYAQGGVRNCQVLRLRQSDYIIDTETYTNPYHVGLRINSRFEIQSRGKVILEDPLEAADNTIGLFIVGENAHLINRGKIIVEKSIESSLDDTAGIVCDNQGRFDNFGHVHFKGILKGIFTTAIYNCPLNNSGTINFESDIVSSEATAGGIRGGNIENSGSINFKGILNGMNESNGIYNCSLNNSGTINFESDIVSDKTVGVYDGNIENSGSINFKGILNGNDGNGSGIYNCSLNNIGTINFESDINGKLPVVGIYAFDRTIINSGAINFKGALNSIEGTCDGVRVNSGNVNNSGDINFKDEITSQNNEVRGILLFNILTNSGNINFENRLYCFNSANLPAAVVGIDVTSFGYFTNSGNINFNGIINEFGIIIPNRNDNGMTLDTDSLISFNSDVTFDPDPPAYIIGNGEIIYDTGNTDTDKTYYPNTQINLGGV